MKKFFLLSLMVLSIGCTLCAGEKKMAVREPETNYLVVKTDYFTCTFFPKHMFPVWFKTPDGRKFPEVVRFLDRMVINRKAYWLYTDLWAEQEIVTNNENEFVIRCLGSYVNVEGDKVAPGKARAVYTYYFKKNSATIKVTADIKRDVTTKATLVFLQPAWAKTQNFDRILRNDKKVTLKPGKTFNKAKKVTFSDKGLAFAVRFNNSDPILLARYQTSDGFSSIISAYRDITGKNLFQTGYLTVWENKPAAKK